MRHSLVAQRCTGKPIPMLPRPRRSLLRASAALHLVIEKAGRPSCAPPSLFQSLCSQAVQGALLHAWHGWTTPPSSAEVLFLTGAQIAGDEVLSRFFVGSSHSAPADFSLLRDDSLAFELSHCAARVPAAEAAASWAVACSSLHTMPLGGCTDRKKVAADCTVSYGRHASTVRISDGYPRGEAGYQSWGQYENEHKQRKRQMVSEVTIKHMPLISNLLRSASVLPIQFERVRGQTMKHCSTAEHTDRQRGPTMSAVRFVEPNRAALLFRTDILFQISVVSYKGVLAIPFSLHPPLADHDLPMVRLYMWDTDGAAQQTLIPYDELGGDSWVNVGLIAGVVCGLRDHAVLYTPNGEFHDSSANFKVLSPVRAAEMAQQNPFPIFPSQWIALGWDGDWIAFYGWAMIHVLIGDGSVARVHLYSRRVKEHPTCASANRIGYDGVDGDTVDSEWVSLSTILLLGSVFEDLVCSE